MTVYSRKFDSPFGKITLAAYKNINGRKISDRFFATKTIIVNIIVIDLSAHPLCS